MLDEAFWILLCDGIFALVQWMLILRFIYGIFLPENSRIIGVRHNNVATDPIIKAFGFITHDLIIHRVKPLYVAFYFLIIRFYALPTFIGYEVEGLADLSLEAFVIMLMDSFA